MVLPATYRTYSPKPSHPNPFGLLHQGYNEEKHEIQYTEAEEDKIFTSQTVAGRYKYWYQEQERQEDLNLNWDSFKYRNYDYAIGRFMSVDPLAEKYPYNSTYAFSENRVIDARELEGLEWETVKNEDGSTTLILRIQLHNKEQLSDKQLQKLQSDLKQQFADTFSNSELNVNAQLIIEHSENGEGKFVVILTSTEGEIIKKDDDTTQIRYQGGKVEEIGNTQENIIFLTVKVNGKKRNNKKISRSFNHEAGHSAGLYHPWSPRNNINDIKQGDKDVSPSTVKKNIMNSGANPDPNLRSNSGTDLTPGQLKEVIKNVDNERE